MMLLTKKVRLFITNRPKLYRVLSKVWWYINRGIIAKIQYQCQFRKIDKRRNILGEEPLWKSIEIETFNRCNGECSFCPVNKNSDPRYPVKMEENLFEKIINELSELSYDGNIFLHSNNEPFLDSRIVNFMRIAKERVPKAHLSVYTNGTLLTMDKFVRAMKYLDSIYIDNYSDEGIWGGNVTEIRQFCKENIEVGRRVTISMRKQNEVLSSRGGTAPNKEKHIRNSLPCLLVFTQLIVRPDGKVSLCCNDPLGDYTLGDLNVQTMKEVWNSSRYKNLRKALRVSRRNIEKCKYCDTVYTTD